MCCSRRLRSDRGDRRPPLLQRERARRADSTRPGLLREPCARRLDLALDRVDHRGIAGIASRPGARRESLERYVKRLRELEDIATTFEGVRQAYAIQAGREVRVIVDAKLVDDKISAKIAHDIAKKIQDEMTYPGEIKVTVMREVRSVEYAR